MIRWCIDLWRGCVYYIVPPNLEGEVQAEPYFMERLQIADGTEIAVRNDARPLFKLDPYHPVAPTIWYTCVEASSVKEILGAGFTSRGVLKEDLD